MIGKTIAHYRILEKLGGGGMGVVYKAEDTKLKRTVALKFLPPGFSLDPESKARFTQEAQTASSLQHANICTIHDIDETDDGQMYICMDYYEGETLSQMIDRGPLDLSRALDVGVQIARGLARAHEAGIVHRDIKPANIIVTTHGEARILDFGLAKLAGQSKLTRTGSTLGTLAYMSPEQARGEEVGQETDLWSLGAVLYEMLTGEVPFKGDYQPAVLYSILNDEPAPPRSVRPEVPQEIERIVLRLLTKDPAGRYPSAGEIVVALEGARFPARQAVTAETATKGVLRALKKPKVSLPVLLGLGMIIAALAWYLDRAASIQLAKEEFIPKIRELATIEATNTIKAYELALLAEKQIPDDPDLQALWPDIARFVSIETEPPGASVYRAMYDPSEGGWEYIGVTPIESLRVPIAFYRWKIEKEGYEAVIAVAGTQTASEGRFVGSRIRRVLDPVGSIPAGMVRVLGHEDIPDFFIDRFEVSNANFKAFVEQGGYHDRSLWKHEFVREGKVLSWEDAIAHFVDRTGRPSPAGWQAGDYAEGKGQLPVTGISWFEAGAYAEFVGKSLPTVHHWGIARGWHIGLNRWSFHRFTIPSSNFGGEGPVPVGSTGAINPFGVYDMAGNAREWCWNKAPMGRCLRGGAWDDATYMVGNITQASPFDRSVKNGFRCVQYHDGESISREAFAPITPWEMPDFRREKPVSEEVFAIYKEQFSYDRRGLRQASLPADSSSSNWIHERVVVNALYGEEEMVIHIFLPRNASPPYQTVVYFPGSGATWVRSKQNLTELPEFKMRIEYLVANGRAVAFPVYKGTYERGNDSLASLHLWAEPTHTYSGFQIAVVKDFRRCVDYLEIRPDIDTGKLAFLGFSWGGIVGNLIMAVEDRLEAGILCVGGFDAHGRSRPEVDPVHFVPRIKIPVLMLNGEYDMTFPLDVAVRPLYDMLGTDPADKELKVYPTDHFIPQDEVIRESLAWLDHYLG
ncbi:MAG: protein kinase, partial [Bacteroidota bacterium]